MLQHCLLRERAFRTEERDFERLLLREAGGHDLAKQSRDLFVAQRSLVALQRIAQHLRFALGFVEVGGAQAFRALGLADLLRELRALVQEVVNATIDVIDAIADGIELRGVVGRL